MSCLSFPNTWQIHLHYINFHRYDFQGAISLGYFVKYYIWLSNLKYGPQASIYEHSCAVFPGLPLLITDFTLLLNIMTLVVVVIYENVKTVLRWQRHDVIMLPSHMKVSSSCNGQSFIYSQIIFLNSFNIFLTFLIFSPKYP